MKYGTFSSDLLHHSFSIWLHSLELRWTCIYLHVKTWAHKKSACWMRKSRQMEALNGEEGNKLWGV